MAIETFTAATTPSSEPYDLYATDTQSRGTIPFVVAWPTEPTITSTATVTPATFSANNANGREITLTSGTYGNISLGGTDKTLILQSGATVGTITLQGQGLKIVGQAGSIVSQINHDSGASDVMLDGINSNGGSWQLWDCTRFALLNSTVATDGFSVFFQFNPANPRPQDVIVAGCTIDALTGGGFAPVRFQDINRMVAVDTRFVSNGSFASLRIHNEFNGGNVDNQWIRNCQCEGGGWQWGPNDGNTGTFDNIWAYDCAVYGIDAGFALANNLTFNNFAADRNYIYSDFFTTPGAQWISQGGTSGTGWNLGNNPSQGGYVTPPAWNGVAVP